MDADRSAEEIEIAISRATTAADMERIRAALLGNPETRRVLDALSRSSDLDVRSWVPDAARVLLGRDAVPLLLQMSRDSDADVRSLAIDALEALDPAEVCALQSQLLTVVRRGDDSEALSAAWRLAALRTEGTISALEDRRDVYPPSSWQHKSAEVVLLLVTDPGAIAGRIQAHDHEHMVWLAYAAAQLRTEAAIAALQEASVTAPDALCREVCSRGLAHLRVSESA